MLNRNLETTTELQRTVLNICHTKFTSWIVSMSHENRRDFDMYYFEVFNASQYASEEHIAVFSLSRSAVQSSGKGKGQNCTFQYSGSGDHVEFQVVTTFESDPIRVLMSKSWFI